MAVLSGRSGVVSGATSFPQSSYAPPALTTRSRLIAGLAALYSDSFDGTNGAAWPAQWTTAGTVDIQSNQGRMLTPASAYATGTTAYLAGMPAVADAEVTFSFTTPPVLNPETMYFAVGLRASSTFDDYAPDTGYYVELWPFSAGGAVNIYRGNGTPSGAQLTSAAFTWAASTTYRVRFRVAGSVIAVRVWLATDQEPTAWTTAAVDSTNTAAGRLAYSAASGSSATSRDIRIDDLTVVDATPPTTGTPMQHWRAALSVNSATALFIGDSFTEGQGATAKANRWLDLVQPLIRTDAGLPSGGAGYLPSWYSTYAPPTKWNPYTSRTGTHTDDTGAYALGRRTDSMTAAASTTYTVTGTTADLWWVAGYGTFTWAVDGGSTTSVSTAGTTGAHMRSTIPLGASGSHTVTITATTAVRFSGVMVYDGDTQTGVRFYDSSRTGAVSGDFLGMGALWSAVQPDLVVIELGINNYLQNIASTQVKADLQALIAEVRGNVTRPVSIAVVLPPTITAPPDIPNSEPWSAYSAAIASVVTDDTSVQLIDWTSLGSAPGSNWYSDGLHLNDTGQSATASLMRTALAETVPTPQGSGSGSWSFAGSGTGTRAPKGAGTGSWSFSGTGSGKRTPKASGTGSFTFTGAGAGTSPHRGSGSGTWTVTGTGTGSTTRRGSGSGSFTFAGSGSGKRVAKAAGTGSWSFVGAGTGATVRRGTGSGTATWTGSGSGVAPLVGVNDGSGSGSWGFVGTGSDRRAPVGSGSGLAVWTGTGAGVAPVVGAKTGSGTGTWAVAGAGSGIRQPKATGGGTWAYAGTGVGVTPPEPGAEIILAAPTETLVVGADNRTATIGADNRTQTVGADARALVTAGR